MKRHDRYNNLTNIPVYKSRRALATDIMGFLVSDCVRLCALPFFLSLQIIHLHSFKSATLHFKSVSILSSSLTICLSAVTNVQYFCHHPLGSTLCAVHP